MRRIAFVPLALIAVVIVGTFGVSSAHTPNASISCNSSGAPVASLTLQAYNGSGNQNTVTITVDGSVIVDHVHFGSSYSKLNFSLGSSTVGHTVQIDVIAWDNHKYDWHKTLTAPACVQSTTTTTVRPTTTTSAPATTSTTTTVRPTTTTSAPATTSTTTTLPATTSTTTTLPATTSTTTTLPATTTTLPGDTTTTIGSGGETTTTLPGVTTTSVDSGGPTTTSPGSGDSTTTTAAGDANGSTTTTAQESGAPVPSGPTTTVSQASAGPVAPASSALPTTGSSSVPSALIAAAALLVGFGLVRVSRRSVTR